MADKNKITLEKLVAAKIDVIKTIVYPLNNFATAVRQAGSPLSNR